MNELGKLAAKLVEIGNLRHLACLGRIRKGPRSSI